MHAYRRWSIYLIVILLSGCATLSQDFDKPKVDLVGLEPGLTDGMEQNFQVNLRITNPNSEPFTLKGVYFEISVEGHELVTGVSNHSVEVPAFGESQLSLSSSASLMGTLGLMKTLMTNPPSDGLGYSLYTKLSIAGQPLAIKLREEGKLSADSLP